MKSGYGSSAGGFTDFAGMLSALFGNGGKNPADAASPYLGNVPGMLDKYYKPYERIGQEAFGQLKPQYDDLINNPGGKLNDIGQGFQKSPGFDFAVQQALQAAQHAASAGGMAGSPQHEQESQELAHNLANQDYQEYLKNALGLYGQGLEGEQGFFNTGYDAASHHASGLEQNAQDRANLAYAGQANQNQSQGLFSSIGHFFGL